MKNHLAKQKKKSKKNQEKIKRMKVHQDYPEEEISDKDEGMKEWNFVKLILKKKLVIKIKECIIDKNQRMHVQQDHPKEETGDNKKM